MKALKFFNILLFIAVLITAVAMLLYKLPGKLQYSEQMGNLHTWAGLSFFILAIIHIILNWRWIKSQILGIKSKK
ncbi:MAG: DUF4405 domain-containing protein [Candidatus Cloacimonetes bacterium]|nr:DUF4405 domain-containing protein [Candidatus Cloacimonadota bacterium]